MRLRFGKVHVKQFDAYVWCGMAQLVNKVDKLTMQAMLVATHGCSTTKEGGGNASHNAALLWSGPRAYGKRSNISSRGRRICRLRLHCQADVL